MWDMYWGYVDDLYDRLGYLPATDVAHMDHFFPSKSKFKKDMGISYDLFIKRLYPREERETMQSATHKISFTHWETLTHYGSRGSNTHRYLMLMRFIKWCEKMNELSEYPDDVIRVVIMGHQLILQVERDGITYWLSHLNVSENYYKKTIERIITKAVTNGIELKTLYLYPTGKRNSSETFLKEFFTK